MKVKRERNIYLRRIYTQEPHTYSYDMNNGKYTLINKEGSEFEVNANGVLKQEFRPYFSGCVDHRTREKDSLKVPSVLYYTPDSKISSKIRTVLPQKFAGYAQYPYQIQQSPSHLKPTSNRDLYDSTKRASVKIRQRALTERSQQKIIQRSQMLTESIQKQEENFFKKAYTSISTTRPNPNKKKNSCYSNKCRYLKQLALQSLVSQRERQSYSMIQRQTRGISFHKQSLRQQLQQKKRLAKLGLSILQK